MIFNSRCSNWEGKVQCSQKTTPQKKETVTRDQILSKVVSVSHLIKAHRKVIVVYQWRNKNSIYKNMSLSFIAIQYTYQFLVVSIKGTVVSTHIHVCANMHMFTERERERERERKREKGSKWLHVWETDRETERHTIAIINTTLETGIPSLTSCFLDG